MSGEASRLRTWSHHALCAALVATLAFYTESASAQDNKAQAEALFQQAGSLMDKGDYEHACPKLADSMRLDPSSGTEINLGLCYEKIGKTASAWAEYKAAAELARQQKRAAHQTKATQLAARLEPKLSKLRIDAPTSIPGLVVKRDDVEVVPSSLGAALPVDPGKHTIAATAPGYQAWSSTVTVGAESDMQAVTVPSLDKAAPEEAAPAVPTPAPAPTAAPAPARSSGEARLRLGGFVLAGAGVAGIAVGAIFGALAVSAKNDALDNGCKPDGGCNRSGWDHISAAQTDALASTLGIGLGAAFATAGVVLVIIAGPSRSDAHRRSPFVGLAPSASRDGGGASMRGVF